MLSPGTRLTQTQIPSIAIYFYSDPQRIPAHSKIITIMIKAFERERGKPRVSGFMTASCRQKDAGGKMRGCPRYWRRGGTAAWSTRHLCGSCRQEAPPPGLGASEEAPWEEAGRSEVNARVWDHRSDHPRGTVWHRAEPGHPLLCRQGAGSPPARPLCTRPWWIQNADCQKKQEKIQKIRMLKPTKISQNCQRAYKYVLTWRKCDARSTALKRPVRKHLRVTVSQRFHCGISNCQGIWENI